MKLVILFLFFALSEAPSPNDPDLSRSSSYIFSQNHSVWKLIWTIHSQKRSCMVAQQGLWFSQCNPITEDQGQIRREHRLKAEDEVMVTAVMPLTIRRGSLRPVSTFLSLTLCNAFEPMDFGQQRSQCACDTWLRRACVRGRNTKANYSFSSTHPLVSIVYFLCVSCIQLCADGKWLYLKQL